MELTLFFFLVFFATALIQPLALNISVYISLLYISKYFSNHNMSEETVSVLSAGTTQIFSLSFLKKYFLAG